MAYPLIPPSYDGVSAEGSLQNEPLVEVQPVHGPLTGSQWCNHFIIVSEALKNQDRSMARNARVAKIFEVLREACHGVEAEKSLDQFLEDYHRIKTHENRRYKKGRPASSSTIGDVSEHYSRSNERPSGNGNRAASVNRCWGRETKKMATQNPGLEYDTHMHTASGQRRVSDSRSVRSIVTVIACGQELDSPEAVSRDFPAEQFVIASAEGTELHCPQATRPSKLISSSAHFTLLSPTSTNIHEPLPTPVKENLLVEQSWRADFNGFQLTVSSDTNASSHDSPYSSSDSSTGKRAPITAKSPSSSLSGAKRGRGARSFLPIPPSNAKIASVQYNRNLGRRIITAPSERPVSTLTTPSRSQTISSRVGTKAKAASKMYRAIVPNQPTTKSKEVQGGYIGLTGRVPTPPIRVCSYGLDDRNKDPTQNINYASGAAFRIQKRATSAVSRRTLKTSLSLAKILPSASYDNMELADTVWGRRIKRSITPSGKRIRYPSVASSVLPCTDGLPSMDAKTCTNKQQGVFSSDRTGLTSHTKPQSWHPITPEADSNMNVAEPVKTSISTEMPSSKALANTIISASDENRKACTSSKYLIGDLSSCSTREKCPDIGVQQSKILPELTHITQGRTLTANQSSELVDITNRYIPRRAQQQVPTVRTVGRENSDAISTAHNVTLGTPLSPQASKSPSARISMASCNHANQLMPAELKTSSARINVSSSRWPITKENVKPDSFRDGQLFRPKTTIYNLAIDTSSRSRNDSTNSSVSDSLTESTACNSSVANTKLKVHNKATNKTGLDDGSTIISDKNKVLDPRTDKINVLSDISSVGASMNPRIKNACNWLERKMAPKISPSYLSFSLNQKENEPPHRANLPTKRNSLLKSQSRSKPSNNVSGWFRHATTPSQETSANKAAECSADNHAVLPTQPVNMPPADTTPLLNERFSKEEVETLIHRVYAQLPKDDEVTTLGGRYYTVRRPSLDDSPSKDEKERNPIGMCMSLLDSAASEKCTDKKERLLAMCRILVDAISKSNDAECASEEAKLASMKAEQAAIEVRARLAQIVGVVRAWWSQDV